MMRQLILVDGVWVDGAPAIDEWYKQEVEIEVFQEQRNVAPPILDPVYKTANEQVTVNGNPPEPWGVSFPGLVGDSIHITLDLTDDDGVKQVQIDQSTFVYQKALRLPMRKMCGTKMLDEIYQGAAITGGSISIAGRFPTAGNWELNGARISEAITAIGEQWAIEDKTINFLIAEADA